MTGGEVVVKLIAVGATTQIVVEVIRRIQAWRERRRNGRSDDPRP